MFRRVSVIKKSDKSLRPATLPVLRRYAKSLEVASGLLHSMALAVSACGLHLGWLSVVRLLHFCAKAIATADGWFVIWWNTNVAILENYLFGGVSDRVGVGVCLLAYHFFGFVDRGAITCRSGEFDLR